VLVALDAAPANLNMQEIPVVQAYIFVVLENTVIMVPPVAGPSLGEML
jgi:hypothetical protein